MRGGSHGPVPLSAHDSGRRPVDSWLTELERLRASAAVGNRPKVTILDISDHADSGTVVAPTSPRSVEALMRLGIDPITLARRPLDFFLRQVRGQQVQPVCCKGRTPGSAAEAASLPSADLPHCPTPCAAPQQERGNEELAQLAYDHEEALRRDRLKALNEERRRLEEGPARGAKVGGRL